MGHQAGLENCLVVLGKVEASFPLQKRIDLFAQRDLIGSKGVADGAAPNIVKIARNAKYHSKDEK